VSVCVNLNKAEIGDIVYLRCGGECMIFNIFKSVFANKKCYHISFGLDFGAEIQYEKNGKVCGISPSFDIVKVDKNDRLKTE